MVLLISFNPIPDGDPRTSFSTVTSPNFGTSPQNLLTLSFNPFVTLLNFHGHT